MSLTAVGIESKYQYLGKFGRSIENVNGHIWCRSNIGYRHFIVSAFPSVTVLIFVVIDWFSRTFDSV